MMTYLLPGNSSMAWNLVSGCDFGDFVDYTNLHFYPSDDNMIEGARGLPAIASSGEPGGHHQGLPALA